MDVLTYITENAYILIPALLIVGQIVKNVKVIPDKWIPLILLPLGVVGAMALGGWTFESVLQGILVTGVTVYGNQIYKQLSKKE